MIFKRLRVLVLLLMVALNQPSTCYELKTNPINPNVGWSGILLPINNMKFDQQTLDRANYLYQAALHRGLTKEQAIGTMGIVFQESRLKPDINGTMDSGYGLSQWLGERKKRLYARYGNRPSYENQVEFLLDELTGSNGLNGWNYTKGAGKYNRGKVIDNYQASREEWMNAGNLDESIHMATSGFYRPATKYNAIDKRINYATELADALGIDMRDVRRASDREKLAYAKYKGGAAGLSNPKETLEQTLARLKTYKPRYDMPDYIAEKYSKYATNPSSTIPRPDKHEAYQQMLANYDAMMMDVDSRRVKNQFDNQQYTSQMDLFNRFYGNQTQTDQWQ